MYLGLLTNLEESFNYVVNNFSYDFWKKLFAVVPYQKINSKIDNIWIPEILENIVELAKKGLEKRGYGEERFLSPLIFRVRHNTTPAEEALNIFKQAKTKEKGIRSLANKYGLF